VSLLFFSPFVIRPTRLRCRDILLLPFLRAAAKQDRERISVFAEVDAVAGAEVDLVFIHAGAYAFYIREISLFDARQRYRHFRRGVMVESVEPAREASITSLIDVASQLYHSPIMVT
jgi:hypothetical protein